MKSIYALIMILMLAFTLAACGTKYVVTTKSGQTYIADGPLNLDVEDKTYTVEDKDGNKVKLKQEEVDKVTEQKQ